MTMRFRLNYQWSLGCTCLTVVSLATFARPLKIGVATVRTHINNAMRKRSCTNLAELAALAAREKWNS